MAPRRAALRAMLRILPFPGRDAGAQRLAVRARVPHARRPAMHSSSTILNTSANPFLLPARRRSPSTSCRSRCVHCLAGLLLWSAQRHVAAPPCGQLCRPAVCRPVPVVASSSKRTVAACLLLKCIDRPVTSDRLCCFDLPPPLQAINTRVCAVVARYSQKIETVVSLVDDVTGMQRPQQEPPFQPVAEFVSTAATSSDNGDS